jgi:hypothetical protein
MELTERIAKLESEKDGPPNTSLLPSRKKSVAHKKGLAFPINEGGEK